MRAPVVYSRIKFQNPFILKGLPGKLPAGSYSIETRDRHYWTFPFLWETRTRTRIRFCRKYGLEGSVHEYELDPRDLFAALKQDRLFVAV
jgi:hypothetical protein